MITKFEAYEYFGDFKTGDFVTFIDIELPVLMEILDMYSKKVKVKIIKPEEFGMRLGEREYSACDTLGPNGRWDVRFTGNYDGALKEYEKLRAQKRFDL